jgi:hypothetical protein
VSLSAGIELDGEDRVGGITGPRLLDRCCWGRKAEIDAADVAARKG